MRLTETWFTTGQVLLATDVSNASLQTWLARQMITGQEHITGGGKPGLHRRWTFYNVMEIAAAKALIDAGLGDLRKVFAAAGAFAHTDIALFGEPRRKVGMPFYPGTGFTLLVAGPEGGEVMFLDEERSTSGLQLYTRLFSGPNRILSDATGCVLVNMSRVFDRTVARLNFSPSVALAEEYELARCAGQDMHVCGAAGS